MGFRNPLLSISDGGLVSVHSGISRLNGQVSVPVIDISTFGYTGKRLNSPDADPRAFAFSADGTKGYVTGSVNDKIEQYSLTTPWDISTASSASKYMSVAGEMTFAQGMTFSTDGTKVFVAGAYSGYIYQYNLTTAWDISTGSYSGKSFNPSAQTTNSRSPVFSPDGIKLYIVVSAYIYQYNLTTAWDISTASYNAGSGSIGNSINSIAFVEGGKQFIGADTNNDIIHQYSLTTAWDITTWVKDLKSFSTQGPLLIYVNISSDGTKIYGTDRSDDRIYQYE